MIVVSAFLFMLTASSPSTTDAYSNFKELSANLDSRVEWIDKYGSHLKSRKDAIRLLDKISSSVDDAVYTMRHRSDWRGDQSFRIIHIDGSNAGFRVFFQCRKNRKGHCTVTKIKITEL